MVNAAWVGLSVGVRRVGRVMGNVPGQAHVTPQLHDPTPDPDGHEKGVETGGWVMSGVGYEVEA